MTVGWLPMGFMLCAAADGIPVSREGGVPLRSAGTCFGTVTLAPNENEAALALVARAQSGLGAETYPGPCGPTGSRGLRLPASPSECPTSASAAFLSPCRPAARACCSRAPAPFSQPGRAIVRQGPACHPAEAADCFDAATMTL